MPAAGRPVESQRLFRKADQWFERSRAALLGALPCRPGCSRCCIGPFAVTALDRRHVQEGLSQATDHVRRGIEARAQAQVARMEAAFPDLVTRPFLDEWADEAIDRLVSSFADVPCPALDQDGCCSIYPHRPMTCRLMGIPTESAGVTHPTCEVQTGVPLIRLSEALRHEEDEFAIEEARCLAIEAHGRQDGGEELLLPYAFLS